MHELFLNQENRLRNGWRVAGFVFLYLVLTLLISFPVSVIWMFLHKGVSIIEPQVETFWWGLGAIGATWICLAAERNSFASVGFALADRKWFKAFGLGILAGILFMIVTALTVRALGGFQWRMNPQGSLRGIASGFILFLFGAIHEETLFRGYGFQRLISSLGIWPTQFMLAGAFALMHWHNPGMSGVTRIWASLNIALAGILLGLCYLKTRSLALPIGVHLGWNWAQGNLLGFGVSGLNVTGGYWKPVFGSRPQWLTGGPFGLEASLPCTMLCVLAILALILWKPKQPNPETVV